MKLVSLQLSCQLTIILHSGKTSMKSHSIFFSLLYVFIVNVITNIKNIIDGNTIINAFDYRKFFFDLVIAP